MAANQHMGDQFYGKGIDSLFPEGAAPIRTTPWPSVGKRKDRREYDPEVVRDALTQPPQLTEVDPRGLHATQPMITHQGVSYYADSDTYERTGQTMADRNNPGNRYPFVYRREDGENLLLSGHHRAAAALVKGEPLRAIVRDGPWGPPR